MLLCVTEMLTRADIEDLAEALAEIAWRRERGGGAMTEPLIYDICQAGRRGGKPARL